MSDIHQSHSWPIIESHAIDHSPVHEQIASCDDFYENTIQRIMNNIEPVVVRDRHKKCVRTFKYGKCMIKNMSLPGFTDAEQDSDVTPQICRMRDLSYVCVLRVNVRQYIKYDNIDKADETLDEKVDIGDIPLMVKSKNCILHGLDEDELIAKGECPNDPGGYFILTGKERAIVAQERLSYNQLFVFPDKSGLKAEIRCHCEDTDQQSTIHLKYALSKKQGPGIKVVIPHIHESKGVFLFALFKVLGITTNNDIIKMILYPNVNDVEVKENLEGSIAESEQIETREQAIAYLAQYVKPRTGSQGQAITSQSLTKDQKQTMLRIWLIHIIDRELFPHLHPQNQNSNYSTNDNVFTPEFQEYLRTVEYRRRCIEKAWFLAYAVNRLIRVALNRDLPSDRDHMAHKRLNLSGPLLAQLFKKKMTTQHNSMVKLLIKQINANKDVKISGVMKQVDVTKGLAFSLKTGNWTGTKTNPTNSSKNQGVSQVLNRMNYTAPISHMRRTSASDTNLSVVRQLHNTQYGVCCPR
jgi:DNA-directed RNA polymerase II subunit RPB2